MAKRKSSKKPMTQAQIYERVTNQVLKAIQEGDEDAKIPWRSGIRGAAALMPSHNAFRGNTYRGVNQMLTGMLNVINEYRTPAYATFNQIKQHGGHVKKGESGLPLTYVLPVHKDEDGQTIHPRRGESREAFAERTEETFYLLRMTSPVFNLDQTEGLEQYIQRYLDKYEGPEHREQIDQAQEKLLDLMEDRFQGMGVSLKLIGRATQPHYRPVSHEIVLPHRDQFLSRTHYAEALLHEGTHSTMWDTGRVESKDDIANLVHDKKAYAREELVAEMGSLYLATHMGIEKDFNNQASYLDGWGMVLAIRENPKMFFEAARDAERATDLVLDEATLAKRDEIREGLGIGPLTDFEQEDDEPKAQSADDQEQGELRGMVLDTEADPLDQAMGGGEPARSATEQSEDLGVGQAGKGAKTQMSM